jgi:phosphinothricin acetyltransferase
MLGCILPSYFLPDDMSSAELTIRSASLSDLPRLTEIHNHYVTSTHITFDVRAFRAEERIPWFREHCDGKRYRLLVAENARLGVVGYTTTGRFRAKAAYDSTVEVSVACHPNATGRGIGTALYHALFAAIAQEDIHRVLAGIAQPNPASMALHEKFGFKPIGTFTAVGRKFGKYWDVVWMERPLVL